MRQETFAGVSRKYGRLGRRQWLRRRWVAEIGKAPARVAVDEARKRAPIHSGALRASVKAHARATSDGVELAVESPLVYARVHEEGGTIRNRTGGRITFRARGYLRGGRDKAGPELERAVLDVIEREVLR